MLEDLHIGSPVVSTSGTRLGTLTRVILDGPSDQVVGVVVDPGLRESGNLLAPGGWERPRERTVPVALVTASSPEGIRLSCDEAGFQQLALFEHEQYATVDPATAPRDSSPQDYWSRFRLGDLVNYLASGIGLGAAPYLPPNTMAHTEPPTAGAIGAATPVWRIEPHERIGEVEHVLADEASQRVTALVVRRGGLAHQRVLLPATAIVAVEDGVVHARVTDAELEALAPYQPER